MKQTLIILTLFCSIGTYACRCPTLSVEKAYKKSDRIFTGKVIGITKHLETFNATINIEVINIFKGLSEKKIEIKSQIAGSGECGYKFTIGMEYLIFANKKRTDNNYIELETNKCSGNGKVSNKKEWLTYLKDYNNSIQSQSSFGSKEERIKELNNLKLELKTFRANCNVLKAQETEDLITLYSQPSYLSFGINFGSGIESSYELQNNFNTKLDKEIIYARKCKNYDAVLKMISNRLLFEHKYPFYETQSVYKPQFLYLKEALNFKYKNVEETVRKMKIDSIKTSTSLRIKYCYTSLFNNPFKIIIHKSKDDNDAINKATNLLKNSAFYKIMTQDKTVKKCLSFKIIQSRPISFLLQI